jgi:hypothetical protein
MADRPARETDDSGRRVHSALADPLYSRSEFSEGDMCVPAAVDHSNSGQSHLGAPPIRWGWWGAGVAFSAGLWACLALLLFWL